MTTLTAPSLERRLLRTVREEVEAKSVREWPEETVELCMVLLWEIRRRTAGMLRTLEQILAEGVEARSFVRDAAPLLAIEEENAASIDEIINTLSSSEDPASAKLLTVVRSLEKEEKAFRDLLAEALARVSVPPPAMDWDRLKQETDADFASGRFVTFTTPEEMAKGLADSD